MGQAKIRKASGNYGENIKIPAKHVIGALFPEHCVTKKMRDDLRLFAGPDARLQAVVFQLQVNEKIIYACIAGGFLSNGDVMLTETGRCTVAAMLSLPVKYKKFFMQEVMEGPTSAVKKIKDAIYLVQNDSAIVFFGDVQKHLDHDFMSCLSVNGSVSVQEL